MVRQRSAKPLFPSSNLGAASINYALIAQLDRVSDYESEGREFESLWAHQTKSLAIVRLLVFFCYDMNSSDENNKTI